MVTVETKMNIIDFITEGITDLDAPSLYGKVPGRGLYQLWDEKVSLTDTVNILWLQADLFKNKVRELYSLNSNGIYYPTHGVNKTMPFIRTYVDGFSRKLKRPIKIVVQAEKYHTAVSNPDLPIRGGRVSERNWIEAQHSLAVLNTPSIGLISTLDGTSYNSVVVNRDPVFISNHVAECILFWDYVRRGELPPNAIAPQKADEILESKNQEELPFPRRKK